MALSSFSIGLLLISATIVLFGAHTSFSKSKKVIESNVLMPIYNVYFLIGVSVACFIEYIIIIIFYGSANVIEFSYLGLVSAFIIFCFELFLLLAIQQIGISYAMALHVFSAAITAAGIQVILGQPIVTWWVMVIGLCVITTAVFLMTVLKSVLQRFGVLEANESENESESQFVTIDNMDFIDIDESAPLVGIHAMSPHVPNAHGGPINSSNISDKRMGSGFVLASIAGVFFSFGPLPSLYASENSSGLNFFVSFGVGCVLTAPLSALLSFLVQAQNGQLTSSKADFFKQLLRFDNSIWHFKEVFVYGFSAGLVWGVGNIAGFCSFLYLDYVIVTSFVQCNIIIGLLFGVLLFKEISNKIEFIGLLLLSLMLIAGCLIVTVGVYGTNFSV